MISVIMGVHAVDQYLNTSIQSILDQTYSPLELLIIANGPHSADIEAHIQGHFPNEAKIRVIQSRIPQLGYALNLGLDHARYDYIARMDSDDIALPRRLEKQLAYLQKHGLDLVGCDLALIDSQGKQFGEQIYPKGKDINRRLPVKNPFAHISILAKKQVFIQARGYNAGFNSEDYDLWLRLGRQDVKWDNMPDKLMLYRIHDAASQGRVLGYAECSGYALREFLLNKSLRRFLAIFIQLGKTLIKPTKK